MPHTAPHGPTILVADDSSEQRALYAEILTGAGFRVVQASDGAEAVTMVERERPSLVLMDVTMPGTSGWNAVRVLKENLSTSGVPIIVVTGLVESWDRDASIAAGADEYLAKPVSPTRLLEEVQKFFAR